MNVPQGPAPDPDGLPPGYPLRPEWEVTVRQVQRSLAGPAEGRPLLLDCRSSDEWQACRIEGAVHIPMNEVERRADELEDDRLGRSRPIVVHCHHGQRSLRVTAMLQALGFTSVSSMAGGIDAWSVAIDPGVARY